MLLKEAKITVDVLMDLAAANRNWVKVCESAELLFVTDWSMPCP